MQNTSGKGMNIGLWIAQVLLALGFGLGGWGKLLWPMEELQTRVPWASAIPEWLMRFIGFTELLGAIGLILPSALRIRPSLTPLAATGLLVIMVLAALFHLFRAEYILIPINLIYIGIAYFIIWGRKKSPILAK